jgi:SAM-dependent methyltransferase
MIENASRPNPTFAVEGVGLEPEIYARRFSAAEEATREAIWMVLCAEFLQEYVAADDVVVDLGAGDGHFSRNIKARRRIAVDLSEHVRGLSRYGVETLVAPGTRFADLLDEKADVVFMSNFLEHLPNKRVLLDVFEECRRALKPGGKLVILQPNIRYVGPAYWDYIDHHIALTEFSLVEGLEVCGFQVERLIPRFLPYTARSKLGRAVRGGRAAWLTRAYLRLPLFWRWFGRQTFVAARVGPHRPTQT